MTETSTRAAVAAGLAAGYFLGRTKKAKLALVIASYALGRKAQLHPKDLVGGGMHRLGDAAHLGGLGERVRHELVAGGRSVASAALHRGYDTVADSLASRTRALREGRVTDAVTGDGADERSRGGNEGDADEERAAGDEAGREAASDEAAEGEEAAEEPADRPTGKSAAKGGSKARAKGEEPAEKPARSADRKRRPSRARSADEGAGEEAADEAGEGTSGGRSGGRAKESRAKESRAPGRRRPGEPLTPRERAPRRPARSSGARAGAGGGDR